MFDYQTEQLLAQREREMRDFLLAREAARRRDRAEGGLRAAFASRLVRLALALHPAATAMACDFPEDSQTVPQRYRCTSC